MVAVVVVMPIARIVVGPAKVGLRNDAGVVVVMVVRRTTTDPVLGPSRRLRLAWGALEIAC